MFFEEWVKYSRESRNEAMLKYVENKMNFGIAELDSVRELKMKIAKTSSVLEEKFNCAGRNVERFFTNNADWLSKEKLVFKVKMERKIDAPPLSGDCGGRHKTDFKNASKSTKWRRVENLIRTRSVDELTSAAALLLRINWQRKAAAALVHDVSSASASSSNSSSSISPCKNSPQFPRMLSANEALAFYADSKSSKYAYEQTRFWSLKAGHKVFPSYKTLQRAKLDCYPQKKFVTVTETRAEVKLQAILDKTAERLVQSLSDDTQASLCQQKNLTLMTKWGCDGSSNHSIYKQKLPDLDNCDEYLFLFSLVPLTLRNSNEVFWQNPKPSSTLYCRPLKFMQAKESSELIKSESQIVSDEIDNLVPTSITIEKLGSISIEHKLLFTMLDGKAINALTDNRNSQSCYICQAKPSQMNDSAPPSNHLGNDESTYKYRLSTLHAYIKCFENLKNISYRLKIKKWQVTKKDTKSAETFEKTKEKVQRFFKTKMNLTVDKVRPGYGTSNDGNTARKFFSNPTKSSSVTKIDEQLIRKLGFLLKALSSGHEINVDNFRKEAEDIRQLYISQYPWYPMCVTLHKILAHSSDIASSSLLPIGQLCEDAQEARNKDYRRFRERNTRKCSRTATNQDLLNHLLLTSDPLISSLRNPLRSDRDSLPLEVRRLLIVPESSQTSNATESGPSDDDGSSSESSCDSSSEEGVSLNDANDEDESDSS